MQRLLIALSNFIDGFIKKPEPIVLEEEFALPPVLYGVDCFINKPLEDFQYYINRIYDEELDYYITIQYMCACGEPVYSLMGEDTAFACVHCDCICKADTCTLCHNLNSVDFGAEDADL